MTQPAQAQLGAGWVQFNPTKKIHLDDDLGLQTFAWTSYKSVCSPICADYTYDGTTDTETFRIFDSRSNRSEIRLEDNYSGGSRQFQGYLTFDAPLHDESLHQIFGNTGSAATFAMMRGYSDNNGTIRVMGGSHTIASGIYGVEVRINIIHAHNVSAKYYVNGSLAHEKIHNDPGVVNYQKYGVYGTTSGNVPAIVKWRSARYYRDGAAPVAGPNISATPSSVSVGQGNSSATTINVTGFSGSVSLSASGLPSGATATFNPASVGGGAGSSTMTVSASAATPTGTYPLTVTGTDGASSRTTTVNLTVFTPLPAPWNSQDIGAVAAIGSATYNNGTFTLNGSGADIWGTADEFHYAYQPFSGDVEMIARVATVQNVNAWTKAGVMIRETLGAGSAHVAVYVTPGNGVSMQYRDTTGGSSISTTTAGITAPHWVRLVRSGDTFTGYQSADGINWTVAGSATVAMAAGVNVGLPLTSHVDGTLATATFDNVTVGGSTPPPPQPPEIPTGLAATAGDSQVALAWNASSGATSYNVKRSTTSGGPYTTIASPASTSHTDSTAVNGTTYFYAVSAVNSAGESANSSQVSATPQAPTTPTPPTSLTAVGAKKKVTLSWAQSASPGITQNNIYRSTASGGPYTLVATVAATATYANTGLTSGTTYHYVVTAVNSGGLESPFSNQASAAAK